ncbi:DNA mismatch repair protein MutT [Clostridiaceae bacterium 14S0207]|nr:DNA mismatch repair protein MutT [Clostridiaceae bacterium 14S0207]
MIQGKDYIGVGVGAVILNENKELLLLLRNKSPEKGFWSIPGGKVEFFETLEEAIIREVKEELDVDVKVEKLLGVTNHILKNENAHWVAPSFLTTIENGEVRNVEPEKHLEVKWFSLNKLPENLTLTTKKALEYLRNI